MSKDRLNLPNPIHTQEATLKKVQAEHVARMQESGILQKAQRAYVAEYMPVPSAGGATLDVHESLEPDQFTVSHEQNNLSHAIMIMQAQYHPIIVGTIIDNGDDSPKIEANQKQGFNVLDVKSVASMVEELEALKNSGELVDLTSDLQRIEQQTSRKDTPIDEPQLSENVTSQLDTSSFEPNKTDISLDDAIKLLAYGDVLPEQHQSDAVDAIKKGESTMAYAQELVELYAVHGREKVEELAQSMVEFCNCVLKDLNIPPTIYAPSKSWALWDIAKQSYLAKHPDKSTIDYQNTLSDPFALTTQGDQKRAEIRERHVGWEVMRRYDQGEVRAADLNAEALEILTKGKRNETGQLRSYELAKLGQIVAGSLVSQAC